MLYSPFLFDLQILDVLSLGLPVGLLLSVCSLPTRALFECDHFPHLCGRAMKGIEQRHSRRRTVPKRSRAKQECRKRRKNEKREKSRRGSLSSYISRGLAGLSQVNSIKFVPPFLVLLRRRIHKIPPISENLSLEIDNHDHQMKSR